MRRKEAHFTAGEIVQRWDAGELVSSIEMGGIGPGYEQAIQVLAIEIVRDKLVEPLAPPGTPMLTWADETVHRVNAACGGFSGAQVGAAKSLAYQWLRHGDSFVKQKRFAKRRILVSKFWPHA